MKLGGSQHVCDGQKGHPGFPVHSGCVGSHLTFWIPIFRLLEALALLIHGITVIKIIISHFFTVLIDARAQFIIIIIIFLTGFFSFLAT